MQQEFCNPYHFVPVEKSSPKKSEDSSNSSHGLSVVNFDNAQLQHYSHAAYHSDTFSGRIICRLTTEEAMFVGALREQLDPKRAATVAPFELEGQPAIPASTLRGLISSIAETASHSALRVLNDQVLSFRKAMGESLPALGMVVIKPDEQGKSGYYLKPLALPLLQKAKPGQGYTYGIEDEPEKKAYVQMFKGNARLKVYIRGYDIYGKPKEFVKDKKTFCLSQPQYYYARLREHKFVRERGIFVLPWAIKTTLSRQSVTQKLAFSQAPLPNDVL